MREMMTPEQVASYLQVNTATVYRLIRSHELPARKEAGRYLMRKNEIDSFLEAHADEPNLRGALFQRVLEIADANPGVDSDELLNELEAYDHEMKAGRVNAQDE